MIKCQCDISNSRIKQLRLTRTRILAIMATEEDVDKWDFVQTITWFEEKKIPYEKYETIEEMKTFVKIKRLPEATDDTTTSNQRISQTILEKILKDNNRMKKNMRDIYAEMKELTGKADGVIRVLLKEMYGDYEGRIKRNMENLENEECPVLVLGETSSGKSSLINLLIGESILPTALLAETNTVCCLHNSTERKIEVSYTTGEKIEKPFEEIGSILGRRTDYKGKIPNRVDVFCPIPILPDKTIIVDSPGVGENDGLTEKVLKYLPQAVAFIFVLDSSNAGGIQTDKLGMILEKYETMKLEDCLVPFDFEHSVVICNKWDVVEENNEDERVWDETKTKLKQIMPCLDEKNIFKMSSKKALRHRRLGFEDTEQFQQLLQGLKEILPSIIQAKLSHHYRWQCNVLNRMKVFTMARINNISSSAEEKVELKDKVMSRLKNVKAFSKEIQCELEKQSQEKCEEVVESLHSYLMQPEVKKSFSVWENDETQDYSEGLGDSEILALMIKKKVCARMHDIISRWESEEHKLEKVSTELNNLLKEKCSAIDIQWQEIDFVFEEGQESIFYEELATASAEKFSRVSEILNQKMSTTQKLVIAVTSPIWIPVGLAVTMIVLAPVALGLAVHDVFKDRNVFMIELQHYSEKVADTTFRKENLKQFVTRTYFSDINKKIREHFQTNIEKEISATKTQLKLIKSDISATDTDSRKLSEFWSDIIEIIKKLNPHSTLTYLFE